MTTLIENVQSPWDYPRFRVTVDGVSGTIIRVGREGDDIGFEGSTDDFPMEEWGFDSGIIRDGQLWIQKPVVEDGEVVESELELIGDIESCTYEVVREGYNPEVAG